MRIGCFLPNERSALARRPPTFGRPSLSSMKGLLDSNSERFLGSSCLMVSRPSGQASDCICIRRYIVASMLLVALFCCWTSNSAFFHDLPRTPRPFWRVPELLRARFVEKTVELSQTHSSVGPWFLHIQRQHVWSHRWRQS